MTGSMESKMLHMCQKFLATKIVKKRDILQTSILQSAPLHSYQKYAKMFFMYWNEIPNFIVM